MLIRVVKYAYIIASIASYAVSVSGQTTVDTSARKKNNIVEVLDRIYFMYDGSPAPRIYPWYDGISYTRFITGSHALTASYHYNAPFYEAGPFERRPGDIMSRYVYLFKVDYQYPLLYNHKVHLWINGGLVYRRGHELVHIEYLGVAEALVEARVYRDWGMGIGAKVTRFLPWNFLVSAEAGYNRFLYLYHRKGTIIGYPWFYDEGAPPNMMSFGVSIGYRF